MTELTVDVENVGGIDSMTCTFTDDLGIITGPNSSNKTSLLEAIAFGLGRSDISIKNDAETARVELTLNDRTVVREAYETDHGIRIEGEGWLNSSDDVELFDQFACLFEFSDVRAAVRNDENFAEVLKGPMNIDALEAERERKIVEKNELKKEVDSLENVEDRLEERKRKLDEKRKTAAELESELEDLREEQRDLTDDEELEGLQAERSRLVTQRQEYREQISDYENAIDRLEGEISELEADLEAAREQVTEYDVNSLRAERESIQEELHEITDRIDVLQSVLTANREMHSSSYTSALGRQYSLTGDRVTCWACGNEAAEEDFEETIGRLTELIESDKERRTEYQPRLEEIDDQIEAANGANRLITELESKKQSLEQQLESRRDSLETHRQQLEDVEIDLDEIEDEIASRESQQESESSHVTEELESTRVDLHAVQNEIDRLEDAIDELEEDRRERERKSEEIESLRTDIRELTERIENLEQRLRDGFNEAMDELIELLGYETIDRVWLDGNYDLVVAREEDGVTRQDTVQNLSESEREMVGLVLALAGYLAYDVADAVPVLLVDTLGAFDANRASSLLEYFADEAPLLITALLPENEATLADTDLEYDPVNPSRLTV
ncbi:archaea-specific SMC-related protein [Natrinema gelatinilyticum]|uniref:archaea-specific SMC-related protein n=1 Tax=Natrinema gelatinilyticum TaxID=2961571 RepID=UPI0020C4ABE5|nr:archaea-specific SMC-related protein [Natrinema gelatinilyticum]